MIDLTTLLYGFGFFTTKRDHARQGGARQPPYYVHSMGGGYQQAEDPAIVSLVKVAMYPTIVAALIMALSAWDTGASTASYAVFSLISSLLTSLVFGPASLYRASLSFPFASAMSIAISRWLIVVAIIGVIGYSTGYAAYFDRPSVSACLIAIPFALVGCQSVARLVLRIIISAAERPRTAVIAGMSPVGLQLYHKIIEDGMLDIRVAGFFDDRKISRSSGVEDTPLLGPLSDLAPYVKEHPNSIVYICLPIFWHSRIVDLLKGLGDTTASVYFVPDVFMHDLIQPRISRLVGLPTIAVCEGPFLGLRGVAKTLFDFVLAAWIVLIISPILLICAIGVKLSSPGPIIFKQSRYGLDGKEILVYKFRTMRLCECDDRIVQATRTDSRVTPFGSFMRRTSLDELPQFFNVLEGKMSIVGPRPHAVYHNETYRRLIKAYMLRHKVKPGITGWAQVNGFRGETETIEKMRSRVEYDLEYLRHWSIGWDAWIILRTIRLMVLGDQNAY